ncbi:MAG: type I-E CRISPR-associated protein Cas6/Cse3/CasE [Thermomicrobiales bacterium]
MYLSRLVLNPMSREVRRDVTDCHALHRRVMSGFPDGLPDEGARAQLGVLYRLDVDPRRGDLVLLVQSSVEPNWARLPAPRYLRETAGALANPDCKPVVDAYAALRAGDLLAFRLRANPTRKIRPDGATGNGKRVELRDEEARLDWLRRKGEQGGFALPLMHVRPNGGEWPLVRANPDGAVGGKQAGWQRRASDEAEAKPRRLTFGAVVFEGVLRVTDAERFRATLAEGIGPGKAYGFGLLSVASARG